MTNKVGIEVGAKDNASGPIDNIRDKFDKLQKQGAKGFGLGVGVAAGAVAFNALSSAADAAATAVVNFAVDSIEKAKEEEVGIARLNEALKANIAGWNGNTDAIEAVIAAREKLAFSDGEQRDALALLVTRTHDVNKALGLEREAMDLARLKGMSLADASEVIGKVYSGNVAILTRYGIAVRKGATSTEALADIQQAAAGQAEAFANTSEGAARSLQIAIDDLQEDLGKHLLPVVKDLAVFARDDLVPALDDTMAGFDAVAKAVSDNQAVIAPLIDALELLSGTYKQLHQDQQAQQDGEKKAQAISDSMNATIADRVKEYQPYIDRLNAAKRVTAALGAASAGADSHIKELADQADNAKQAFDDMRSAIRDAAKSLGDQKYGTDITKDSIKLAKLELKDNIDHLHKLEAIKDPTRSQREDILKTKIAVGQGNEDILKMKADLVASGKVSMSVTDSWLQRVRDDGTEAGDAIAYLKRQLHAVGAPTSGSRPDDNRPPSNDKGRASGGPVLPGNIYTVGENEPETLIMGANGGMVIPSGTGRGRGGSSPITITIGDLHFHGSGDITSQVAYRVKQTVADAARDALREQRRRQ